MVKGVGVFCPIRRQIAETVTVYLDKKIQFRDTGIYIQSSADGKLKFSADGGGADDFIFSGSVTFENDVLINGSFTFGSAVVDTLVLNGRVATGSVAGSALDIDATYSYGEGVELRYQVTNWTGVGNSFKGMYLRAEAATNSAAGKSVYGTNIYGVCNNVTMTTGSLWGTLTYAYVKGVDAVTINNIYAGQFELSWDAGRTGDCTITTEAAVILAKVTGGRVADYTKIHGIIVRFGEMDGDSQTFGNGILIEDDSAMSGTSTFTNGVHVTAPCTSAQFKVSGTAILASGEQAIYVSCSAETVATNGVWVTLKSTVVSGDLTGGRFKVHTLRGTSGGPNVRGVYGQALSDTADKFAALLQGGLFVASYVGATTTAVNIYGVTGFIAQGSGLTCTGNCAAVQAHLQTRSDESIGVHTGVLIHNEAVGGNGLVLAQGAIYVTESSLGGSVKGYECLIDGSTATLTDQGGNEVILFKFKDSGGTAKKLVYDTDNATVVAVASL